MKKNTFPFMLSIILLSALILSACSLTSLTGSPTPQPTPIAAVSAPGLVTAEGKLLPTPAVQLAFAQGGVVAEVLVKPGDKVAAGDVLARLVGVKTVEADMAAAQAQFDQTYNAAMAQDQTNRSKNLTKNQISDFTLPQWYFNQQEQTSADQATVDQAQAALTKAQQRLTSKMQTTGADFIKAESDLANAQSAYIVAKNLNDRIKNGKNLEDLSRRQMYLVLRDNYLKSKEVDPKWVLSLNTIDQDLRDQAQNNFDDAESALKDAQRAYDDAASSDGAKDVQKARAQVNIAQETLYTAMDYVRSQQTGSQAETLATAQTALDKAKAALDLYELRAPIGGTILSFGPKAGETASPGVPVAFLADTSTWTVETKDLAEIDIAKVELGQKVSVKLDALPGQEFPGTVTNIDPVGKEYLGDMTYKVTVTLDKVDPHFLWNMTATVNIEAK